MGPLNDAQPKKVRVFFVPGGSVDPMNITIKDINGFQEISGITIYGRGKMASTNYTVSYGEAERIPTVKVDDLWEVFPELKGGKKETPQKFADKIARAATLARQEDAYESLRGRVSGALEDAFDHGYVHGVEDALDEKEDDDNDF